MADEDVRWGPPVAKPPFQSVERPKRPVTGDDEDEEQKPKRRRPYAVVAAEKIRSPQ